MVTEARPGVNGRETFQTIKDVQRNWRLAGQDVGFLRRLGQSVELPQSVSAMVYDATVNNLPWYMTEQVPDIRERLRDTHPVPIIAISLIADERSLDKTVGISTQVAYPERFEDESSRGAWENGAEVLTEVATEIIEVQARTSLHHSQQRSRFLAGNLDLIAYGRSFMEIQELIGEEVIYDFHDALAISHMTGDNSYVQSRMQMFGWKDFDEAAIVIGSKATPLEKVDDSRLRLSKSVAGFVRSYQPGIVNILANDLVLNGSLGAEALLAGVHGLFRRAPYALDALYFGLRHLKDSHLYLSWLSKALVHEMVHYLSQDNTRLGFIPLKVK